MSNWSLSPSDPRKGDPLLGVGWCEGQNTANLSATSGRFGPGLDLSPCYD